MAHEDWRLNGQKRYLDGAVLVHRTYRQNPRNPTWDHDHCAFCQAKFTVDDIPDVLHEGYTTADEYHWICGSATIGLPISRISFGGS